VAVKTFYLKDVVASGSAFGSLQDGGTAPTAANMVTGWTVGKIANTVPYSRLVYGTKQATGTFNATDQLGTAAMPTNALKDAFRSENTYTGLFPAGSWSFAVKVRATVASAQNGALVIRVWASTSATGASGNRELTTAIQTGTTATTPSTTVDSSTTVTWSAPNVILNNEYLFVQMEWKITVAGGSNTADWVLRAGSAITTTNFVQGPTATVTLSASGSLSATVNATRGIQATKTLSFPNLNSSAATISAVDAASWTNARAMISPSVETSSKAKAYNSGGYIVYQAYWSFDTSSLAGRTVLGGNLQATITDILLNQVQLTAYAYDWGSTLTSSDAVPGANLSSLPAVANLPTGQTYGPITFTDLALAANINTTGTSRFVIATDTQLSASFPSPGGGIDFNFAQPITLNVTVPDSILFSATGTMSVTAAVPKVHQATNRSSIALDTVNKGSNIDLTNGNLTFVANTNFVNVGRVFSDLSSAGVLRYFEARVDASNSQLAIGVADSNVVTNDGSVGTGAGVISAFVNNGALLGGNNVSPYGTFVSTAMVVGQIIGIAFNDTTFWVAQNNAWITGDPNTLTGGYAHFGTAPMRAFGSSNTATDQGTFRFSPSDWTYAPPTGAQPFYGPGWSASGTLIATVSSPPISISATFSAAGNLTATPALKFSASATLSASGTLSAAVSPVRGVSATMSAAGNMTGGIAAILGVASTQSASGTLTAAISKILTASSILTASGTLTGTINLVAGAGSTIEVTWAQMIVPKAPFTVHNASAIFTAAGTLAGTAILNMSGLISEILFPVDTTSAQAVFSSTRTEAVTAQDTVTSIGTFGASVVEILSAVDSQSGGTIYNASVAETLSLVDSFSVLAAYNVSVGETLAPVDAVSSQATFANLIQELLAAADAQAAQMIFNSTRGETLSPVDFQSAQASFFSSVAEVLNVVDSNDGSVGAVTYSASVAEVLNAVDSVSATGGSDVGGGEVYTVSGEQVIGRFIEPSVSKLKGASKRTN
jgi:hypothetical protein